MRSSSRPHHRRPSSSSSQGKVGGVLSRSLSLLGLAEQGRRRPCPPSTRLTSSRVRRWAGSGGGGDLAGIGGFARPGRRQERVVAGASPPAGRKDRVDRQRVSSPPWEPKGKMASTETILSPLFILHSTPPPILYSLLQRELLVASTNGISRF
ncbi:unnamed protein product [Urochloa humidicola]